MTKPVIAPGIENHLTIAVQRDVHLDVLPPGNGDNDYAFDDVDDLDVLSPVNDDHDHDAIEDEYDTEQSLDVLPLDDYDDDAFDDVKR